MAKTGSTAVREELLRRFKVTIRPGRHRNDSPFPDFFTFVNCRNPYTRVPSLWWGLVGHGEVPPGIVNWVPFLPRRMPWMDFLDWYLVEQLKCPIQCLRHVDFYAKFRCDTILRQEHLSDDFSALPFVQDPVTIPPTNIFSGTGSGPPPYSELYDQAVADRLYEHSAADFTLLGYKRDSWKGLTNER